MKTDILGSSIGIVSIGKDLIDQSNLLGSGSSYVFPGKSQFSEEATSYYPRQSLKATKVGHHCHLCLPKRYGRVRSSYSYVASSGEIQSSTDTVPMEDGYGWFAAPLNGRESLLEPSYDIESYGCPSCIRGGLRNSVFLYSICGRRDRVGKTQLVRELARVDLLSQVSEVRQVQSYAEMGSLCSDDHCSDLTVRSKFVHNAGKGEEELGIECIESFWSAQPNCGKRRGALDLDDIGRGDLHMSSFARSSRPLSSWSKWFAWLKLEPGLSSNHQVVQLGDCK